MALPPANQGVDPLAGIPGRRLGSGPRAFDFIVMIRDGDVVTVTPLKSAVSAGPGEVAAFKRPGSGRLTVHRLVRRVSEGWVAFLPRGVAGLLLARLSRVVLDARQWLRT